jgi:hypothetical protein
VLDVTNIYIKVLDDKITGFKLYLLAAERRTWVEVETFVKKELPKSLLRWKNVQ